MSFARNLPRLYWVPLLLGWPAAAAAQGYVQTNLVSDQSGVATHTDANLVNAWGLARSSGSAWWVADNGVGVSTLYDGSGNPLSLVVTIPPPSGSSSIGSPTGVVGGGSLYPKFTFDSLDGAISQWTSGSKAVLKVDHSGAAVYTGLAAAPRNGALVYYAANFFSGQVEAYDTGFNPVSLAAGAFQDPMLPAGFAPFGIQMVGNNKLIVCFGMQNSSKNFPVRVWWTSST